MLPPLDKYIEDKLQLLGEQFKIKPKAYEISHLHSLKTEMQVDAYVRDLFKKYL